MPGLEVEDGLEVLGGKGHKVGSEMRATKVRVPYWHRQEKAVRFSPESARSDRNVKLRKLLRMSGSGLA
jgi:hypothetical protein